MDNCFEGPFPSKIDAEQRKKDLIESGEAFNYNLKAVQFGRLWFLEATKAVFG